MHKNQWDVTIREGEVGAQVASESNDIIAVIDVLRMSSTIVTALAHGAKLILPFRSVEETLRIKRENPDYLIGGERRGFRPAGFDFGNSPCEYLPELIGGKIIAITTSNGTRILDVLKKTKSHSSIIIASTLNVTAAAKKVKVLASATGRKISLLAVGRVDVPSPEDHMVAHVIREFLFREKMTLTSRVARAFLKETPHGRELRKKKLSRDLDYCAQIDLFDVVPMVNKQFQILKS